MKQEKYCLEQFVWFLFFQSRMITQGEVKEKSLSLTAAVLCQKDDCKKRGKRERDRESLQWSASTDNMPSKQTLCDVVDWQWCMANMMTYVIYF